jgi:hypothetical protein
VRLGGLDRAFRSRRRWWCVHGVRVWFPGPRCGCRKLTRPFRLRRRRPRPARLSARSEKPSRQTADRRHDLRQVHDGRTDNEKNDSKGSELECVVARLSLRCFARRRGRPRRSRRRSDSVRRAGCPAIRITGTCRAGRLRTREKKYGRGKEEKEKERKPSERLQRLSANVGRMRPTRVRRVPSQLGGSTSATMPPGKHQAGRTRLPCIRHDRCLSR